MSHSTPSRIRLDLVSLCKYRLVCDKCLKKIAHLLGSQRFIWVQPDGELDIVAYITSAEDQSLDHATLAGGVVPKVAVHKYDHQ